jgi:GNAT superfamily N-acetyltransferase
MECPQHKPTLGGCPIVETITINYQQDPTLSDEALNALFARAWPAHRPTAFGPVLARSVGYIGAFDEADLIGFVNVVGDGGRHAFLLDPTVDPAFQRRGIGTQLVQRAADLAARQGCEWLHVDFEARLADFYGRAGFRPTAAGLMALSDRASTT